MIRQAPEIIADLEEARVADKDAVRVYLTATKHDLCHDQRKILAQHFGLEPGNPEFPETLDEFATGCDNYQLDKYGTCRTQQLQEEIRVARLALAELQEKCREALCAAVGLPFRDLGSSFVQGIHKLKQDHDRLEKFKELVHQRLDAMGVDPCSDEECRAGARMNQVELLVALGRRYLKQTDRE